MHAKPFGVIYKIVNTLNGKVYVGQTVKKLAHRWSDHRSSNRCRRLYNSIRKYGPDAFTIQQIAVARSQEELDTLEVEWIAALGTLSPRGYNLRLGGNVPTFSEDSRRRMSAGQKLRYTDPEQRAKNAATVREQWADPEFRAMYKLIRNTPEARAGVSARAKRRYENPEARAKASAAAKRRYKDPEARALASAGAQRRYECPQQRAKSSEASKRRYENPLARAETSAAVKRYYHRQRILALLASQIARMNWN